MGFQDELPSRSFLSLITGLPLLFAGSLLLRLWARSQQRMIAGIRSFSWNDAESLLESDKEQLSRNIADFMKQRLGDTSLVTDAEAMDSFVGLVRS